MGIYKEHKFKMHVCTLYSIFIAGFIAIFRYGSLSFSYVPHISVIIFTSWYYIVLYSLQKYFVKLSYHFRNIGGIKFSLMQEIFHATMDKKIVG